MHSTILNLRYYKVHRIRITIKTRYLRRAKLSFLHRFIIIRIALAIFNYILSMAYIIKLTLNFILIENAPYK